MFQLHLSLTLEATIIYIFQGQKFSPIILNENLVGLEHFEKYLCILSFENSLSPGPFFRVGVIPEIQNICICNIVHMYLVTKKG